MNGAPLVQEPRVAIPSALWRRLEALAVERGRGEPTAALAVRLIEEGVARHVDVTDDVPAFAHVLLTYRDAGVRFPDSPIAAEAAWRARWKREPRLVLADVLANLRADCRVWRTREDQYVPGFGKWITSGRESLAPELTGGRPRAIVPTAQGMDDYRARAEEHARKHDTQAASKGLCRCGECWTKRQGRTK